MIWWLALFCALASAGARADGGTVQIREEAGPFRITVFSAPEPLRAGAADLSVLIQRLRDAAPVLDADVAIRLDGPPPAAPLDARATRDAATNKWLHAALVEIPSAGSWRLRVAVRASGEEASVAGTLQVAPRAPPLRSRWPYLLLPPLLVAAFAIREWRRPPRAASPRSGPH